jgi:hypothetical protein
MENIFEVLIFVDRALAPMILSNCMRRDERVRQFLRKFITSNSKTYYRGTFYSFFLPFSQIILACDLRFE